MCSRAKERFRQERFDGDFRRFLKTREKICNIDDTHRRAHTHALRTKVLRMGCKSAAKSTILEEETSASSSLLLILRVKETIREKGEKRGGTNRDKSDSDDEEDGDSDSTTAVRDRRDDVLFGKSLSLNGDYNVISLSEIAIR